MLILRPSNSGLKRLINIQKCRSSTKLDHCAPLAKLIGRNKTKQRAARALLKSHLWGLSRVTLNSNSQVLLKVVVYNVVAYLRAALD